MADIDAYLGRSGYYCTDRAESSCPSELRDGDDEKEDDEDEEEDGSSAGAVYVPPGPARGMPVDAPDSFTIGSPRSLVEQVQGKPTKIDRLLGETWWYGASQIEFRSGKVFSWEVGTVPLHATMSPKDLKAFEAARERGKFTLGDTKDAVLAVQAVPTRVDRLLGDEWWYQGSRVEFSGGRVISWDSAHYAALDVYLDPKDEKVAAAARERGFYGKGAKKDEVLAIEGVPAHIDLLHGETWWYGASRVEFSGGRVRSWDGSPMRALKAR